RPPGDRRRGAGAGAPAGGEPGGGGLPLPPAAAGATPRLLLRGARPLPPRLTEELPPRPALARARRPPRPRRVELGIAAEDAVLIERDPARRREVGGDPWPRRDAIVERDQAWNPPLEARHRVRERVAHPRDHLERRQVHVAEIRPDQPTCCALPVTSEDVLQPAEVLRHALLQEELRAPFRLALLILVVEAPGDRVVRVVDL